MAKGTRQRDYLEYLVKWKEHPVEYSTWMNVAELEAKDLNCVYISIILKLNVCIYQYTVISSRGGED